MLRLAIIIILIFYIVNFIFDRIVIYSLNNDCLNSFLKDSLLTILFDFKIIHNI
jgi:hypothetical protein